jgi:hypothetical protein
MNSLPRDQEEGQVVTDAAQMLRNLGLDLGLRRKKAGLSQAAFGARAGFSRGTVSHAETGNGDVSRDFWRAADRVLSLGNYYLSRYDLIGVWRMAEPRTLPVALAVMAPARSEAADVYRHLGWPVTPEPAGPVLNTGTIVDALEISREAGVIAARWWHQTGGRESMALGLPALPPPHASMAVIDAGPRWYFLVSPGTSPWPPVHAAAAGSGRTRPRRVPEGGRRPIRWHVTGGRIPVPPAAAGQPVTWAHLPEHSVRLPPPLALCYLLDWAAELSRNREYLALPRGTNVVPARVYPAEDPAG